MITSHLISLFERDITKLVEEVKLYPDDASLWKTGGNISNSGGNLCLHLAGNLQHFIGALLGESGYVRNRDAEFALKNISREKVYNELEGARHIVKDTLEQLSKRELEKPFPIKLNEETVSTEYFLLHLALHLNYHLGQVNYHRRLLAV